MRKRRKIIIFPGHNLRRVVNPCPEFGSGESLERFAQLSASLVSPGARKEKAQELLLSALFLFFFPLFFFFNLFFKFLQTFHPAARRAVPRPLRRAPTGCTGRQMPVK